MKDAPEIRRLPIEIMDAPKGDGGVVKLVQFDR
jgi:hypothetical protein